MLLIWILVLPLLEPSMRGSSSDNRTWSPTEYYIALHRRRAKGAKITEADTNKDARIGIVNGLVVSKN